MKTKILHRDDLQLGGFAGLKEHRLVMDPRAFGPYVNPGTWPGIGNFVYLADARFDPKGETHMHDHREVDVISVMVEGRIAHEGSLEHGQELNPLDVQVQRAGGEGFSHNEINPDDSKNRMLQLWMLPDKAGEPAGYRHYQPQWGEVARVYGGNEDQPDIFPAQTVMDVALLDPDQEVSVSGEFIAYLAQGGGTTNGESVSDGDMVRGGDLNFKASDKTQIVIIHLQQP